MRVADIFRGNARIAFIDGRCVRWKSGLESAERLWVRVQVWYESALLLCVMSARCVFVLAILYFIM